MFAIFKREVRSCFHGMIGYVLTAFLLVASAIYFVALNLGYGLPDFGYSCSPARCRCRASCWASSLPYAWCLRCPAWWTQS